MGMMDGFFNGFLPAVERRRRREVEGTESRSYMDMLVQGMGAFLGRQDCTEVIACRTGKFVQNTLPGAELAVMMVDSLDTPDWFNSWFGIMKKSVFDRKDECYSSYNCSLSDEK